MAAELKPTITVECIPESVTVTLSANGIELIRETVPRDQFIAMTLGVSIQPLWLQECIHLVSYAASSTLVWQMPADSLANFNWLRQCWSTQRMDAILHALEVTRGRRKGDSRRLSRVLKLIGAFGAGVVSRLVPYLFTKGNHSSEHGSNIGGENDSKPRT